MTDGYVVKGTMVIVISPLRVVGLWGGTPSKWPFHKCVGPLLGIIRPQGVALGGWTP